jgi:VWFA-related protein
MRAAACCALAALAGVNQQATFSSRLEAVRLDVSVTERGTPVKGLTAADFEVWDNGVRQDVTLVASESVPVDLVLALDMSGSVTGDRLDELRRASWVALDALVKGDKASLLTFTQQVRVRAALTDDVAAVRKALGGLEFPGHTSMTDAVHVALAQADAGSGRAVAIVFSDGVDTSSWLTPTAVIETAKRLDVVLFGITTDAPRRDLLEELADASGGELIRIRTLKELGVTLQSLLDGFRQRYLLSFVPRDVTRAGWHTLKVRVKKPGAAVKARAGYFGS